MSLQALKILLRKHIANNQLAKFFTSWEAEVRQEGEIGNLFILKKGQWKELARKRLLGILSTSEESQKNAILVNDLLTMVGNLNQEDLLSASATIEVTSGSSSGTGNNDGLIKLLQDKIDYLKRRHIIESGASAKYQLAQEIAEAEADLQRLLDA